MRRLLLVAMDYPPMPYGIAAYSLSLADALARGGLEVTVLAYGAPGAAATDEGRPFRTVRSSGAPVVRHLSFAWVLLGLLRRGGFDAAWHTVWTTSVWSWFFRPVAPVPYFISAHASEILDDTLTWRRRVKTWLAPVKRRALGRARGVFALSRYSAGIVRAMGVPQDRIVVATGGVDPARFTPPKERAGRRRPRLVTLARLDLHKGHDRVIEALAMLRERGRAVDYRVCGDGDERARLGELARRLKVEDAVEFLGWVPDERLPALLQDSDIFVMPSREMPGRLDLIEGLGIAYLEASACGLPVVGGRSGGVPDAVKDGETGLLVDADDARAIADALERLLDDPALAARLGAAGRLFAEREVAWDRVAARIRAAMERLLP